MRTLHELYCILWEEVKDSNLTEGICIEIDLLFSLKKITSDEWRALRNHFKCQKPYYNQHQEFTKHPSWRGRSYWWNDQGESERKRFIKLMMEITK